MSRNLVAVVIVILVLLLGGWYLMRPKQTPAPTSSETTQSSPSSTESANTNEASGEAMMGEVREVKVSGFEFGFTPGTLNFKKGEKVRLTLENTGKMPHDLKIDELGVKTKMIKPGETDTVEFTVEKVGTFEMYCSVGNHRAQGMKGTVQVQ